MARHWRIGAIIATAAALAGESDCSRAVKLGGAGGGLLGDSELVQALEATAQRVAAKAAPALEARHTAKAEVRFIVQLQ